MNKVRVDTGNSRRDEGRGTQLAVAGAVAGLVPAVGLGLLRFLNTEEPEATDLIAGSAAFVLIYLSPYTLALVAARVRNPTARGGFLLAIGLLSLVASLSLFLSLVSLVLLPATILIWIAAVRSLTGSDRSLADALPAAVAGLLISALIGLAFFTLLLIEEPEARCWVLTRGADGQYHWESRPNVGKRPGSLNAGLMTMEDKKALCTSNVITNTEAAMTLGILVVAFLGTWGFMAWASYRDALHQNRRG